MDTVMSLVLREASNSLLHGPPWAAHKTQQSCSDQQSFYHNLDHLRPKIVGRHQSACSLRGSHRETSSQHSGKTPPYKQKQTTPPYKQKQTTPPYKLKQTVLSFSLVSTKPSTSEHASTAGLSLLGQEADMNYPSFAPETGSDIYGYPLESAFHSGYTDVDCLAAPHRPSHQSHSQDDSHLDVDSPLARLSFSRSSSPSQVPNRLPSPRDIVLEARQTSEEERSFEPQLKPARYPGERSTHLDSLAPDYLRQADRAELDLELDHQAGMGYIGTNRSLNSHQQHNGSVWSSPSLRREVAMHDVNSISNSLDSFDYLTDGNIKYDDSDYSNASIDTYTTRYITPRPQAVVYSQSQENTQCSFSQSLSQAASPHAWSASASPVSQTANDSARASPIDPEDGQEHFSEDKLGKSKIKGGLKPRGAQNLPPCRVCGNMASGLHFGVNTCEACNEFFRRSLKRGATYYCSRNRECQVYGKKRNACSYCRYQRCVEMGMSRDAIKTGRYSHKTRTEYAMEVEKFKLKEVNRAETEKHQVLVADLVKYHDKYVKVTTRVPDEELLANQKTYLQLYHTQREHERRHPPLKAPPQNTQLLEDWTMVKEDLSLTMHDAEMTEHWLRNYINFAKNVPGFKELALSDQASLVRGSWFEFWFLGAFRGYNNDLQVVAYPNGRCFHREEIQKVFGQEYTDFSFYLADRMRTLDVSPEVMVLIKTVCLTFPDRTPLENKSAVDRMHWSLVSCLLHTLEKETSPSGSAASFPLVVSKLVELRTLTEIAMRAHKSALFQDVLKDSPLLCEMVDTKTRYVAACVSNNGRHVTADP